MMGESAAVAADRAASPTAPDRTTVTARAGRWSGAAAIAGLAVAVVAWLHSGLALSPTDSYVYLAAGERLNAGHALYALTTSDRAIGMNPPYWTVPTLSPPLLAVLWRPLAALGITGMLLGWAMSGAAYLAAVAIVIMRRPILGLVAVMALAIPIGIQLGLGNVNGFLAFGAVSLWLLRDRPRIGGMILALMVAVKITPIVLLIWLVATDRWRTVAWFTLSSVALLALSVAGASWQAHLDYLGVIGQTVTSSATGLSLAGLLRAVGVPVELARLAPWATLIGGAGLAWRRPGFAFPIAVALMVIASPVIATYWYAILIAALPGDPRVAPP
jgi:alpha-1,2-mannosyltransferase